MENNSFIFFAIVTYSDTNLFLKYYEKYGSRHIRVKHKNINLYTTLFNIQIESIRKRELTITGVSIEDLNNYFFLNENYLLVFDTDETILGKIKFIEFE